MLNFDPIPIGGQTYQLNEISFNEALKVAAIDPKLNEKRITAFLSQALQNQQLPLMMTAQERYFLMIKYVQNQTNTLFSTNTDFSNCFKEKIDSCFGFLSYIILINKILLISSNEASGESLSLFLIILWHL